MLLTIGIGRFQKEDYYVENNSNKNLAMKENSFNTFLLIISNISHEAFNDNAQNHSFEVWRRTKGLWGIFEHVLINSE